MINKGKIDKWDLIKIKFLLHKRPHEEDKKSRYSLKELQTTD